MLFNKLWKKLLNNIKNKEMIYKQNKGNYKIFNMNKCKKRNKRKQNNMLNQYQFHNKK